MPAAGVIDVGTALRCGWVDPAAPVVPVPRATLDPAPRVVPVVAVDPAPPVAAVVPAPPVVPVVAVVPAQPVSRSWWDLRRGPRRAAEVLTTLGAVVAALCFALLVLGPRTGAYQTATMLTGSMAPAIPAGALLVDRPVRVAALHPGDVVTFHAPLPGRPVVSHRLVSVDRVDGRVVLRTKGDANAAPDPWAAVPEGDTVWVVRAVVPGAGTAVRWLRAPAGRAVLVVGLPVLLAGWALLLVWRDPREEE